MLFRKFVMGTLFMMLAACGSTPKRDVLVNDDLNSIKGVTIQSFIWQDEILVQAQGNNLALPLGGGLLVALIDSKTAESRQTEIQDTTELFYSNIDDIDFRQELLRALQTKLSDGVPFKIVGYKMTPARLPKDGPDKIQKTLHKDEGAMTINGEYTFTADFTRLTIQLNVQLRQGGKTDAGYSNEFIYQSAPIGKGGEQSIKLWSAEKAKQYRSVLNEGITELIKMLKIDLLPIDPSIANLPNSNANYIVDESHVRILRGKKLEEDDKRIIIRHADSRLYSVSK